MEWIRAVDVGAGELGEESLSGVAAAGFDGVNVCTSFDGQFTARVFEEGLSRAASLTSRHGVRVVSLTIEPGDAALGDVDRAKRAEAQGCLADVLKVVAPLGLSCVIVSPPAVHSRQADGPAVAYADAINGLLEAMRSLSLVAERSGVTLAVRAPYRGCLLSPVETRELLDSVYSAWVGVCVNARELEPVGRLDDWIGTLAYRVVAVRFADPERMSAREPRFRGAHVSRCLAIFQSSA